MNMITLQKGLYEGKDVGYSQLFGKHPEWYKKFGLKGHNGIDIPLQASTLLYSCINGTVTEVAWDKLGYGKYIKIENNECGVLYAHMKTLSNFKVGEKVKAGESIGLSGNSGNSTGPHLHFGVFPKPRNRNNGYVGYIDPFNKRLVRWVSSIEGSVPIKDDKSRRIKILEQNLENKIDELIEMRESRNKWKRRVDDNGDRWSKEKRELKEHIESLQKTQAENNLQLTNNTRMMADLQTDIKSLRLHSSTLEEQLKSEVASHEKTKEELELAYEQKNKIIQEKNDEILLLKKTISEKREEVKKLKKMKGMDYSKIKLIGWRFGRVFLAAFLVTLSTQLSHLETINQLWPVLIYPAITAGVVAGAKALRLYFGDLDYKKPIHRLPL